MNASSIKLKTFLQFMVQNNIRSIKRSGVPTNSFNGVTFYRKNEADKEVIREFVIIKDNKNKIIMSLSCEDMKSLSF